MQFIGNSTGLNTLLKASQSFRMTASSEALKSETNECSIIEALGVAFTVIGMISELMALSKCKHNGIVDLFLSTIKKFMKNKRLLEKEREVGVLEVEKSGERG